MIHQMMVVWVLDDAMIHVALEIACKTDIRLFIKNYHACFKMEIYHVWIIEGSFEIIEQPKQNSETKYH